MDEEEDEDEGGDDDGGPMDAIAEAAVGQSQSQSGSSQGAAARPPAPPAPPPPAASGASSSDASASQRGSASSQAEAIRELRRKGLSQSGQSRSGHSADSSQCPQRPEHPQNWWRKAPDDYMRHINAYGAESPVRKCQRRHGALIFDLKLDSAKKKGKAYSLNLPDYIVADESESWREKRSTVQLFIVKSDQSWQPLGPPHSRHDIIVNQGGGAYSHWREPMTSGPSGKSHLLFSMPKNAQLSKYKGLVAVVYPMAPPMGWVEYLGGQKKKHQEIFRELFFRTFPTVGVDPHLVDKPEDARSGTYYLWRIGGNHEFEQPLKEGENYERRLPYQIAEFFGEFERRGATLYPPPASYVYYQNKVDLAKLFKEKKVKTPETWIFNNVQEALQAKDVVKFPVVVKDPYGFSSHGIQQAKNWDEFTSVIRIFFEGVQSGIEAIVQQKVVALKEARISYIDGRPFHGYWRIRKSISSASAASNLGGFQSFDFPLKEIAPAVERFANATGVPVGGVDWIWEEENPDVRIDAYTLEVSPTSDLNPPSPTGWTQSYAEFKHTDKYRPAYLAVRRQWTDLMALAVIDRYRRARRHLFVDIDNVLSLSADRVLRWKGKANAYLASEVMRDLPVPDAADALKKLRSKYLIRLLTARGQYEDAFNVTQTWLHKNGFEFDELIVVRNAEDKVAHMTPETLLVDDFTVKHETGSPKDNTKFMDTLRAANLPFVKFPFGGKWADVMPKLLA